MPKASEILIWIWVLKWSAFPLTRVSNNFFQMTDKDTNRQSKLLTVRNKPVIYKDLPFYGACRDVDDFQKLNRVGEGTYGVV